MFNNMKIVKHSLFLYKIFIFRLIKEFYIKKTKNIVNIYVETNII